MATKFYARAGHIFKGSSEKPPKSGFDLERLLKYQLSKLHVPFNDDCCTDSTELPVAVVDGDLLYYNATTDTWSRVGGTSMVVGFIPVAAQNNITAGSGGTISVANYLTTINTDAGGDAFVLGDGTQIGQLKKILLVVDGGGDAVITPTNLAGGTTITMNDAADYVVLVWDGNEWNVIENSGATVA